MPSKNFWPTTNSTFICELSFRTRCPGSIAPLGSCVNNGRLLARGERHFTKVSRPSTYEIVSLGNSERADRFNRVSQTSVFGITSPITKITHTFGLHCGLGWFDCSSRQGYKVHTWPEPPGSSSFLVNTTGWLSSSRRECSLLH